MFKGILSYDFIILITGSFNAVVEFYLMEITQFC